MNGQHLDLVRAEVSRLAARRFVQVMVVVLLAAFAVTVATTLASSHRPSPAELAQAQVEARQERESLERYLAECRASQTPRGCSRVDPDEAVPENHLYGVFVFERQIRPLTILLGAFLALFGFLVAASFVGAEMTSGGMTNLLLWRPRRVPVLAAKLGTVLGAVLGAGAVATVVYIGAFWALGRTAGLPGHLTASEWGSLVLLALRGLGMTLVATAVGFAVATVGRHTAAALGLLAAYAVVWEVGARGVMAVVGAHRPEAWMLSSYLVAWMAGRMEFWDSYAPCNSFDGCDGTYVLTWWHAGIVFAALVGVFVGTAFAVFRRRDVA